MNLVARYFFNSGDYGIWLGRNFSCFLSSFLLAWCLFSTADIKAQGFNDLLKNAHEYYDKEQFHSAAQYYQVALGINSADADITFRLAQCYRAVFDYANAARYYQQTLDLEPVTYPLATFYLAQMQKSLGNFKIAREGFESFIDEHDNSQVLTENERNSFIRQAKLEVEGCGWAIEQMGKSWTEMGFAAMPAPVNSINNDYALVATNDNTVITLTSGRKGVKGGLVDNRFGEYFSDNFRFVDQGGKWAQQDFSDHFDRTNTKYSDGVGTYNSKGDKYYFTSCYEGNAYCKLYVSRKENGVWRNPELLNDNVNAPGYDNRHPALTTGGDTLIFVSNRPGGKGGNDLWYSVTLQDESWGQARPVPGAINTPFNEASPFCSQENLLFFSSDGHSGMGGMDIFMSKDFFSSQNSIKNLGTPFNSGYDDSFFSLGNGKGYVSSNRPGGPGRFDIYQFTIPTDKDKISGYLEETADGTQLRSRIRDSNGSNLYAARDEDQFYYDNLSAEERARLDRIIAMKRESEGGFEPSDLPREDYKYYKKLDMATKATIERLANKRALEIESQSSTQFTIQEKLDWEFYQNIDDEQRSIIDRILDIRVEARRRAISGLDSEEQDYALDPSNQDRIESKLQLLSLGSLAETLSEQKEQGENHMGTSLDRLGTADVLSEMDSNDSFFIQSRIQAYTVTVNDLSMPLHSQYQQLAPKQRYDLHQSSLRSYIINHSSLDPEEKQMLLSALDLEEDPLDEYARANSPEEFEATIQIRDALSENMASMNLISTGANKLNIANLELKAQQLMLRQQLDQVQKSETDTRDLQDQIKQFLSEQESPSNPELEQKLVEEIYLQSQLLLPLLTPRESYYFNALTPGRQLRIERLAGLVMAQTGNLANDSNEGNKFIVNQNASDQWYYQELSASDQMVVDELVSRGWDPEIPYNSQQLEFISGLSEQDRSRIERMMGTAPRADLELPVSSKSMADQPTVDKEYYLGLSPQERKIVDELIARGGDSDLPYSDEQLKFISNSSNQDQDRIKSMMGIPPGVEFMLPEEDPYIEKQWATDQEYYLALSDYDQKRVDELVARGWNPEVPYNEEMLTFIAELTQSERAHINYMMVSYPNTTVETSNSQAALASNNNGSGISNSNPKSDPNHATSSVGDGNDSYQPQVKNSSPESAISKLPVIANHLQNPSTNIYFDLDQHILRSEAKKALNDLMQFLNAKGKPVEILIEGHADATGTKYHNQQLSTRRSNAAAEFLEPSSDLIRITTKGYGESRPVITNRSPMGRQYNRRVELSIKGIRYEPTLGTFLVKPGVTLDTILKETGLLKEDLIKWNGPLSPNLRPYQPLRIPIDMDCNSLKRWLQCPIEGSEMNIGENYHLVTPGENLYRLSIKYRTTVKVLEKLNNISASELKAGQKLRIR